MKKLIFFSTLILLTFSEVQAGCDVGDCKNGFGTYTWSGRSTYEGHWQNGRKNGQGQETWNDGARYVGGHQNGKRHGYGTFTWKDGRQYQGQWEKGKRHGEGTYLSDDGSRYEGEWKMGKQHGSGILYLPDGRLDAGLWENGYYIGPESTPDMPQVASKPIEEESKKPEAAVPQQRTALVIGNSNYRMAPLRNPVNDALAMANVLKELGFEVMSYTNVGNNDMKQALRQFGEKLAAKGGVGLFYFAGHGMQVKGTNYLIPVDGNILNEHDIEYESVELNRVMSEMEYAGTRMNIVILDACRNDPFSKFRSSFRTMTDSRGLARIEMAPYGTFIAFATAPGSVAADGFGFNGLYTQELVNAVKTPGLKIEDVFKRVRTQVRKLSGGEQIPWENSSIEGDFYFVGN